MKTRNNPKNVRDRINTILDLIQVMGKIDKNPREIDLDIVTSLIKMSYEGKTGEVGILGNMKSEFKSNGGFKNDDHIMNTVFKPLNELFNKHTKDGKDFSSKEVDLQELGNVVTKTKINIVSYMAQLKQETEKYVKQEFEVRSSKICKEILQGFVRSDAAIMSTDYIINKHANQGRVFDIIKKHFKEIGY